MDVFLIATAPFSNPTEVIGTLGEVACSALPFRETLGENKDVSKRITDVKFFEAPGLRPDLTRRNHIG
jgi:hypothetical protein